MSNLERAVAWANLGCPVFPCYEADTWVGAKLHARKSPRTSKGFLEAVTNLDVIQRYWSDNPSHLVGVVPKGLVVLDIDMNLHEGKDGWFELGEAGIEVPPTFNVDTPSGGNHYFFRAKESAEIPPVAGLTLGSGVRLPSVDRRSGGSYFIAWSEAVPSDLDELIDCPDWLKSVGSATSGDYIAFSGGVQSWIEALEKGNPSTSVLNAIGRFPDGDFGHGVLVPKQAELVHLGAAREPGVEMALNQLRSLWLRGDYNTLHYQAEWDSALAGAIHKFGGNSTETPSEEDMHEIRTRKYLEDFRARRDAERRLAAEDFEGLEEYSWDELGTIERSYLVQDLVPKEAIVFLVAKSNMGKTFAYIDMICRMQFQMPWLGKQTTPAKTLVVLGEGMAGIKERFNSWCALNGKSSDVLREQFLFVSKANLCSDLSLRNIKEIAERHRAELIVYDTWSNVSGVPSEDDAALNAAALRNITDALPSVTHFFVHHPRKSSEDSPNPVMRGSSVLPGRSDVVMTMFRDKEYISAHGISAEFLAVSTESSHAGKNRDAMTETIRGAYVQAIDDHVVFSHDATPPLAKRTSLVIRRLTAPMTAGEYAEKFAISESAARRELKAGVEDGHVTVSHPKNPNVAATYSPNRRSTEDVDWGKLIGKL